MVAEETPQKGLTSYTYTVKQLGGTEWFTLLASY